MIALLLFALNEINCGFYFQAEQCALCVRKSMYTITFSLAVLANNFIVLRIRKDTQMMKDSPWACTYLILHQYRMILSRTMTISCTIYIVPVTSFLVSSLISWDSTKRK